MNDYSYNDMMRMQTEAKKRVMEMQKRSRDFAREFNSNAKKEKEEREQESQETELPRVPKAISYPADIQNAHRQQNHVKDQRNNSGINLRNALFSAFGNLSSDEYEKMFILSLCLLLAKENKDDSLMFSLMYLLT